MSQGHIILLIVETFLSVEAQKNCYTHLQLMLVIRAGFYYNPLKRIKAVCPTLYNCALLTKSTACWLLHNLSNLSLKGYKKKIPLLLSVKSCFRQQNTVCKARAQVNANHGLLLAMTWPWQRSPYRSRSNSCKIISDIGHFDFFAY